MKRAFLSELVRFHKTARTTVLVMVGFTSLITLFTFIGFDGAEAGPGGGPPGFGATDLSFVGGNVEALLGAASLLGIAALSMFALSVARDYETGTIRLLLVGQPKRAVVLGGKLLALVAVTIVGVTVAATASVGLSFLLAPGNGIDTALWTTAEGWNAVWGGVFNTTIMITVWGVIGATLALVTRSAASSITAGIAYLMIGENLLGLVWAGATD